MATRPIFLFTDFGIEGPYIGQMKAVIVKHVPGAHVIDLMHDAPRFDPRHAAYLLAAIIKPLPRDAIVVGVVDPGVGTERPPVALFTRDQAFIGPGSGLFEIVARHDPRSRWLRLTGIPEDISATFHGRDVFAPAAVKLALGEQLPGTGWTEDHPGRDWPADLGEIIYIDGFGNAVTGLRASEFPDTTLIRVAGRSIPRKRTFADVGSGEAFCYTNSFGLIEIAAREGHAAKELELSLGQAVEIG